MLRTLVLVLMFALAPASTPLPPVCGQDNMQPCTLGGVVDEESTAMEMALLQTQVVVPTHEHSVLQVEEAEALDMANLAKAAYGGDAAPASVSSSNGLAWERTYNGAAGVTGHDFFYIYKRDSVCAVAFSGSNDDDDWLTTNAQTVLTNGCGRKDLHKGIFEELVSIAQSDAWKQNIAPQLATCNGGVYAVGHSLGGALASMLAFCANAGQLADLQGADAQPFTVSKLYTYGAPRPAIGTLSNTPSGCFLGKRFYTLDDGKTYDPVPALGAGVSQHPALEAIQLSSSSSSSLSSSSSSSSSGGLATGVVAVAKGVAARVSNGYGKYVAPRLPSSALCDSKAPQLSSLVKPKWSDHAITVYIERIAQL